MVGENGPQLDGWQCCPHRDIPHMTKPAPVPSEAHICLGEN